MVPSSIGPYRIIEGLGSGANGEVYLAEDTRLGRKVAVKTLIANSKAEPADARRWVLREARAAARLNHPNIASVYDVLESPSGAHIVMEYVRGETLAARVREGPLPPAEVMEIGIQLAEALGEAHAMGVVHRDLKPGNAVITPKGHVKILDFGLAKVGRIDSGSASVRSSAEFTLDGQQVGTPPYMPPEHLMGDPADARGDIYSLGVMLFEMLTGRRPFRGPDAMALVSAILSEPTPRARETNPRVPPGLDAVVYRAMSRRPHDRYATARELAYDLRRVAAGDEPLPAGLGEEDTGWIGSDIAFSHAPTRSRHAPPLWSARRPRALTLAGLGLLAVLAVLAMLTPALPPSVATSGGPPVVAVLPLAGAAGDVENESLATGVADTLISSLSRVPGLTVVSRQATLPYRDRKKTAAEIARDLGATVVVDGTVQRAGDRVRVTLGVLRPESNVVAWSNTYDGTFSDVFALQSEVAAAVSSALQLSLSPTDRQRVERPSTTDVAALAEYAQARTFLERPDLKDSLDHSLDLFRSAIRKDPRFARAHAGLGEALWQRYVATRDEPASVEARDEINEALRLDPEDPSVRVSLAAIYKGMGRNAEAIEELRRVTALRPGDDDAHELLGRLLVTTGRFAEGIAELQRAIQLRPTYWRHFDELGRAYYGAGRFPSAVAAFRRVTELQPDNGWGFHMLGTSYHAMDDVEHAVPNYRRAIELGTTRSYSNLGLLYFHEKRYAEAVRAFEEAVKGEPTSSLKHHNLGDAYFRLGRAEDARKEYERAAELSEAEIRVMPGDFRPLGRLALIEAKLERYAAAERHLAAALALAPSNADVLYGEAVIRALEKRPQESLDALAKAVENGYSAKRAASDPDLAEVRALPEFTKAVSREPGAKGGGH